jgi:hypothetical protein
VKTSPARYSPSILHAFDDLTTGEFPPGSRVLDPCAGNGDRLANLAGWRGWDLVLVEIEENFAGPGVIVGDSTDLPSEWTETMDGALTSITYANGCADKGLRMKNPQGRLTYDLANGKPLHPNNTGAYGVRQGVSVYRKYLDLNGRIFAEVYRTLKPGAPFLLNCSDSYKVGVLQTITADNVRSAVAAGFVVEQWVTVPTPRHRGVGANSDVRVDGEYVVKLRKSKK